MLLGPIFVYYLLCKRNWFSIYRKELILIDDLILLFLLLNLSGTFIELSIGEPKQALRVFIYKVIPVFLYFAVSRYMTEKDVGHILLILLLTSTIVAGELLYERYYNIVLLKPCPFQIKNANYVTNLSGETLLQLKSHRYRSPGILEHLHATNIYIGLGVICATYWVHVKKNTLTLTLLLFIISVLVIGAARTAVISTLIASFVFVWLRGKYLKRKRNVVKIFFSFSFILGACICLMLLYKPLYKYYSPLFEGKVSRNYSFIEEKLPTIIISIFGKMWNEKPIGLLFGYPGTTLRREIGSINEEFFVMSLIGRYGVIGILIFYSIYLVFVREALFCLRKASLLLKDKDKTIIIFSVCIVTVLILSTAHSGALMRKGVYPWLFVGYGIGRRYFCGIYPSIIK